MAIYLTSDLHFNHNRNFIYEPRGFKTVSAMNEAIIERFNSTVDWNDDIYILGDLCLGGSDATTAEHNQKMIELLNGNIHVILGNHDTPRRIEMYRQCKNILEVSYANILHYKKYHFYLSHYPTLTSNWDNDKSLKQRVINMCGHTHTKDPFADWDKSPIYHIEVDAHDCYPCLLDDAIQEMNEKVYLDKTVK